MPERNGGRLSTISRSSSSFRQVQGVIHDALGLCQDGVQVRLIFEALRVDLVNVLRPRRPGRKPTTGGDDLQPAYRGIISRGASQSWL